jgi:hypothetical protein
MENDLLETFATVYAKPLLETQKHARCMGITVTEVEIPHPDKYKYVLSTAFPDKILGIKIVWK